MLLTGLGWDETLVFETRDHAGKKEARHLIPGQQLAISISDDRACIGYRPPGGKSLIACPDRVIGINSSQCPECFQRAMNLPCLRCVGDYCRNPIRRSDCVVEDNHALYLAAFSDDLIKVGVARWNRRSQRVLEQGAQEAVIIARDDGQMIRRSEAMIKALGLPDRVAPAAKLEAAQRTHGDLRADLLDTLESLKRRMKAKWIEPEFIELPGQETLPHTRLLDGSGINLYGQIKATIGQLLVIEDPQGEAVAVDATALVGRRILDLDPEQGPNYQMALLA